MHDFYKQEKKSLYHKASIMKEKHLNTEPDLSSSKNFLQRLLSDLTAIPRVKNDSLQVRMLGRTVKGLFLPVAGDQQGSRAPGLGDRAPIVTVPCPSEAQCKTDQGGTQGNC